MAGIWTFRSRENLSLLIAENFGRFAGRLKESMETGRMNFSIPECSRSALPIRTGNKTRCSSDDTGRSGPAPAPSG